MYFRAPTILKDYYKILELEEGVGLEHIKKSYRRLAKKYHPDSAHPHSSDVRFIEVNEAYEFLADAERRASYEGRRKISEEEEHRREAIYRKWVEQHQNLARKRAQRHSSKSFEEFRGSKIYKTAMIVDRAYNYIFIAIGIGITILPVVALLLRPEEEKIMEGARPSWHGIFPVILGLLFTYGIYYFLFKHDPEDE